MGNNISEVSRNTFFGSRVQYLNVNGNRIGSIESKGFDLNVDEKAIVNGNTIKDMKSESLALQSPKEFKFANNTVETVYQHAFQLAAGEFVDIENNSFGRLMRHVFHYARTVASGAFTIKCNSIIEFDEDALELNETLSVASLQVSRIQLQKNCSCSLESLVDTLAKGLNVTSSSPSNDDDGASLKSIVIGAVTCRDKNGIDQGVKVPKSLSRCKHGQVERPGKREHHKHPGNNDSTATIIGLCVGFLFILVTVIFAVILIKRRKRREKRNKVAKQNLQQQGQSKESLGAWMMAIPETHIYRESECHIEEEFVVPLEFFEGTNSDQRLSAI